MKEPREQLVTKQKHFVACFFMLPKALFFHHQMSSSLTYKHFQFHVSSASHHNKEYPTPIFVDIYGILFSIHVIAMPIHELIYVFILIIVRVECRKLFMFQL